MFVQCTGTQVSQVAVQFAVVQAARLVRLVQPEKSPAPATNLGQTERKTGEKSDENEINEHEMT